MTSVDLLLTKHRICSNSTMTGQQAGHGQQTKELQKISIIKFNILKSFKNLHI